MKIYIFSLRNCIHCKNLKKKLKENLIDFVDVDITANNELWNQVVEQTQNHFVPCVYITDEKSGEGEIYIPDRDFKSEDEIFEILKNKFL